MKYVYLAALFFFASSSLKSQIYIPLGDDSYHLVDRAEIRINNIDTYELHSSVKPFSRYDVLELLKMAPKSAVDSANFAYFSDESFFYTGTGKRDKLILHKFYRQNAALYDVNTEYFKLSINPMLNLFGGTEGFTHAGADSAHSLYINTRGVELQGIMDNKVSFYAMLTDNQMRLPLNVKLFGERYYAIPGEGYFKNFKSNGYDFYHAEAYVAVPMTKHISMQFGNSNQFLGNGIRTLILSDFSKPHLFLKLNTRVWKFNYENLFYELTDSPYITGGSLYYKKFGATHHISFNISSQFNIGFYESVIFKRNNNAYELEYLNPLIFYRAVEHGLGSPDNVLLGFDFKWNLHKKFQFYGEAILDEFLLTYMRYQFLKPKTFPYWGWWGNKFAGQAGFKYIDVAHISNLDFQIEYNHIRPYTYSYYDPDLSYADFNQSLAHPLGSNLREIISTVWYQPIPKALITMKFFAMEKGLDIDSSSVSYGGDILQPNRKRKAIFGNSMIQGLHADIAYIELAASYRLAQELFLDVSYTYRMMQTTDILISNKSHYILVGIRLNSRRRNFEF
jgi:hypothetical protein